jgi:multiple sugar transport system substrate-binding protein
MCAIIAATVSVSLLASCSAPADNPGSSSGGPAESVELNMLVSAGSSGNAFTAAAESFTEQTGIKVNVTAMPQGDVRQQEILALSTHSDSLDIMPFVADWMTGMMGTGDGLVDIGKLAAEEGYSFDPLMPALLNVLKFKDMQLALPTRASYYVFTYREDLLKEAGFDGPPKTWDEFDTMAKALTDPGKNQYGACLAMAQVSLMVETWQAIVLSHGGTFIADDGTLVLDSAPNIEASQRVANWYKNGLVPPDSLQYSDTEVVTCMQQGRAAMGVISTAWLSKITDPEASEWADQWKIAPRMPAGPNGTGQTLITSWGFSLNPNSKHLKEAWDFIKFTVSPETQLWLATEQFNEPTTSATYEDPAFLAVRPQAPNILSSVTDGHPAAEQFNGWSDVQMGLQAVVSTIYAGDTPPAEGLAAANKDLQKFIS